MSQATPGQAHGADTSAVVGLEPRPNGAPLDHRDADWAQLSVLVAGLGVSGFAAADALIQRGAHVRVVDGGDPAAGSMLAQRAQVLSILGAQVITGAEAISDPATLAGIELVVTSPGWPPNHQLLVAAAAAGIPIWGEVELAWRMRPRTGAAPWLCITGTNGKTTTVTMTTAVLRAAGLRAVAAGNVGTPIIEAVLAPDPFEVIAVELSSFQLHWQRSLRPLASVCLNVAPDHIDWHGSVDAYAADKGRVYTNTEVACIYNEQDPRTEHLVRQAEVVPGCRAVAFTLGTPAISMLGVVDEVLADRAFVPDRAHSAAEIGSLADLARGSHRPAPHFIANALAAAALARAAGVSAPAVRAGLRSYQVEAHRIAEVGVVDQVTYIDDSKATNPHAAAASLAAFEHIVWIAGGLLKGADVDELVASRAGRLRAVVLMGRDREAIAAALATHAPHVPVVDITATDEQAMSQVVAAAAQLAQPGDVVLLAPAAASMDMFANYGARGQAFADAVAGLGSAPAGSA